MSSTETSYVCLLTLAKQRQGMLRAEIDSQRSNHDQPEESVFWRLHRAIAKARSILMELATFLASLGIDPFACDGVVDLNDVVQEAIVEKTKLDGLVFANQEEKAFKRTTANNFEREDSHVWMAKISRKGLASIGGEVNRLYQLLVEGSLNSENSLAISSQSLEAAALRDDFFTPLQRQNLMKRATEVEQLNKRELGEIQNQIQTGMSGFQRDSIQTIDELLENRNVEEFSFVEVARKRSPGQNKKNPNSIFAKASKPPKRIRKGGGYPIWIRDDDVAEFIGVEGIGIDSMKKRCNLSILYAYQSDAVDGMCPIIIKGSKEAVAKAVGMIEEKFGKEKKASEKKKSVSTTYSDAATIWIRNSDVPGLIGDKGVRVKALVKNMGVSFIYADQENLDGDLCPVRVGGPPSSVKIAVGELKRMFPVYSDEEAPVKKTIWILNAEVPFLIGVRGANVKSMCNCFGVQSITAWQDRLSSDGICPVEIKGPPSNVDLAAQEIAEKFGGHAKLPDAPPEKTSAPKTETQGQVSTAFHNVPASTPTLERTESHLVYDLRDDETVPVTNRVNPVIRPPGLPHPPAAKPATNVSRVDGQSPTSVMLLPQQFGEKATIHNDTVAIQSDQTTFGAIITPPQPSMMVTPSFHSAKNDSTSTRFGVAETFTPRELPRAPSDHLAPAVNINNNSMASFVNNSVPVERLPQEMMTSAALSLFLKDHQDCFKCDPSLFESWLVGIGITSLSELAEALDDKDFCREEMRWGLKYYKRHGLRKAILELPTTPKEQEFSHLY